MAVIGGGIAGLSAAWQVVTQHLGNEIVVLEGSPRVGGRLCSGQVAGQTVDVGAESMLVRRPEGLQLLAELGLTPVHPAKVGATIWSRGSQQPMPAGTLMGVPSNPSTLQGLLSADEVARAGAEQPVELKGDIAIGDLVERALGPAVVDRLVEPLLGGVYAGHARSLSAQACVPALYQAAAQGESLVATAQRASAAASQNGGSPVFGGLPGGIGQLPELLVAALEQRGARVRTGVVVRDLTRIVGGWRLTTGPTRDEQHLDVDGVVIASPARATSRLLEGWAPGAAAAIGEVDYASMAIVTYAFDAAASRSLRGSSGFLVPPVDGHDIKAATFSSAKWPWLSRVREDLTVARVSFGRFGDVASLQRPDHELAGAGLADLRRAIDGSLPEPRDVHVQRWGGGLPQYAVGHRARIDHARAGIPGDAALGLAGAAYDGVGIPACIASGRAAADLVVTRLREP
ncbi:protoporphyrinogen oxidase [Leekyejoonella antrihumi]|uniref:Coproporphyrinogen III oxidase n=1 Tax=Leekyejoonella antrihumi TaxID=1660198 RepID=A0A563DTM3_9MICO|nr:protoporphyrinogen oxidase [Leekyejoonella antrihumi]